MMNPNTVAVLLSAALVLPAATYSGTAGAQVVRTPMPQGQRIDAQDGDTIVVDENARVRIVRQRSAYVRVVFNAKERWLIVLARYAALDGRPVRDGVDETYLFRELDGTWPLGDRWEGDLAIETYSLAGESGGPAGFGLRSPAGLVQFLTRNPQIFREAAALTVLSYRGAGRKTVNGAPFDDTERISVAEAMGNSTGGRGSGVVAGVTGGVTLGVDPSSGGVGVVPSTGAARKIHDVRPIWPEAARRAGIQGTVIVELKIGADGSVANARILRGIPQLDEAALECVRQWRYEPTLLNGQPAPVTITAIVSFP